MSLRTWLETAMPPPAVSPPDDAAATQAMQAAEATKPPPKRAKRKRALPVAATPSSLVKPRQEADGTATTMPVAEAPTANARVAAGVTKRRTSVSATRGGGKLAKIRRKVEKKAPKVEKGGAGADTSFAVGVVECARSIDDARAREQAQHASICDGIERASEAFSAAATAVVAATGGRSSKKRKREESAATAAGDKKLARRDQTPRASSDGGGGVGAPIGYKAAAVALEDVKRRLRGYHREHRERLGELRRIAERMAALERQVATHMQRLSTELVKHTVCDPNVDVTTPMITNPRQLHAVPEQLLKKLVGAGV